MPFKLPKLPYHFDALEPVMSRETVELHYTKHHQGYIDKLNKLVEGTELEEKTLEELIVNIQAGDIYNNAAQAWNHEFFWNCMSPDGGGQPGGHVSEIIVRQFGSLDNFREEFTTAATSLFGSGWVWLARLKNGAFSIEKTQNANNPLTEGHTPLLTLDVWEHAYYVDYRNERKAFVKGFWDLVNWDFVEAQLGKATEKSRHPVAAPTHRTKRSNLDELRV